MVYQTLFFRSDLLGSCWGSSYLEVLCKKVVLKNFGKFTGKKLFRIFFNKVAGLRPANSLKKRLRHSCFPVKFAKLLRTHFFTEHLRAMASVNTSLGRGEYGCFNRSETVNYQNKSTGRKLLEELG